MGKWLIVIAIILIGVSIGNLIIPPLSSAIADVPNGEDISARWGLIQHLLVGVFTVSSATVGYKLFDR